MGEIVLAYTEKQVNRYGYKDKIWEKSALFVKSKGSLLANSTRNSQMTEK